MLEILSYKIDLWKNQREKRKIFKSYERQRDEAERENKSSNEIGMIDHDYLSQMDNIDDQIAAMQQRLLIAQAEKYLIVTPEFDLKDGKNLEMAKTGNRFLYNKATVSGLRDAVRREQKERRERWQSWLTALAGFVAAFTGVIGALIGLLSILQSD